MRKSKFLYFTIKGDNLDVLELKHLMNMPAKIYIKGEVEKIGSLQREVINKTNRWVYEAIGQDEMRINKFLIKHLEIISEKLPILENYIKKYNSSLELIIYDENS